MDGHAVKWTSEAKQAFKSKLFATLSPTGTEDGPLRIQHFGQIPHDTQQRASKAKGHSDHELDFNVAEARSHPPVCSIVCRPDEGIDKVHDI